METGNLIVNFVHSALAAGSKSFMAGRRHLCIFQVTPAYNMLFGSARKCQLLTNYTSTMLCYATHTDTRFLNANSQQRLCRIFFYPYMALRCSFIETDSYKEMSFLLVQLTMHLDSCHHKICHSNLSQSLKKKRTTILYIWRYSQNLFSQNDMELLKNIVIEKDFERVPQSILVQVTENWLTGFD